MEENLASGYAGSTVLQVPLPGHVSGMNTRKKFAPSPPFSSGVRVDGVQQSRAGLDEFILPTDFVYDADHEGMPCSTAYRGLGLPSQLRNSVSPSESVIRKEAV